MARLLKSGILSLSLLAFVANEERRAFPPRNSKVISFVRKVYVVSKIANTVSGVSWEAKYFCVADSGEAGRVVVS